MYLKHPRLHSWYGDIDQKEVDRRHRWPHHVLSGSHKLNTSTWKLWPLICISSSSILIQRTEVLHRNCTTIPKFRAGGGHSSIPQARKHAILCVVFTWVEPTFIQQNTHIASPTPTTISKCDIGIDVSATPSTPHDTCTHKVNHRNLLLQYTRAQGLQFNCLIYLKLLKPGSTEGYYYQHQCAS